MTATGLRRVWVAFVLMAVVWVAGVGLRAAAAAPVGQATPVASAPGEGGEAAMVLPDLEMPVTFLNGIDGHTLLLGGIAICFLGLVFGLVIMSQLRAMPVHSSMREISELIYETCKTYLIQQGKFLLLLEVFIGVIIAFYFGVLQHFSAVKVAVINFCSALTSASAAATVSPGSGIRVNTFANSRTAFAALAGKPYPCYQIPLKAGMSIGMLLISVELVMMLVILLFIPGDYAGSCFIGFAIGESLGASALRIAGGIFTKIADIGADLMKIVFKIKEDDARNPGVIADCTGDNAGDSVGPSADGFETYGVTGVALISFILLAVSSPTVQIQLLVWIFVMRIVMVIAAGGSYLLNEVLAKGQYQNADTMNYEHPLTRLVWLTSVVSVAFTYGASLRGSFTTWATGRSGGSSRRSSPAARWPAPLFPELVKVFTSTSSSHVREIVASGREGGASLTILSGFVAGNFSAYWLGMAIMVLMSLGYLVSRTFGDFAQHARPGPGDDCAVRLRLWPGGLPASSAWGRSRSPSTHAARSPTTRNRSSSSRQSSSCRTSQPRSRKRSGLCRISEKARSRTSRRTMGRATRSRRPPNPCSSARRWSARRR